MKEDSFKEKLDAFLDWLFEDEDDDAAEDIEEDVDVEDDAEEDVVDDEDDWVPHLIAIGYHDDYSEVVVMHDENGNKWGMSAALLNSLVRTWPGKTELDESLRAAFKELAECAHEQLMATDHGD